MAVSMKMTVFWDVEMLAASIIRALMIEAASTYEM
jgi:hypothetical protein